MKQKHKEKTIYKSIRKTTAPPTQLFKNKRQELLEESIYKDEYDICSNCGIILYARCQNLETNEYFCFMCLENIIND